MVSTRALTNQAGEVTDTYDYDAYGNLLGFTGTTVNNYLYTGEQFDSNLGQYYLRARYYDSNLGRFTGRDPFEGFMDEPLSLAKYPYVHGNPVNATDPSGLFKIGETSAAIQIIAALSRIATTTIGIKILFQAQQIPQAVYGDYIGKIGRFAPLEAAQELGLDEDAKTRRRRPTIPILFFTQADLKAHEIHIRSAITGNGKTKPVYDGTGSANVLPNDLHYDGIKKDRSFLDEAIDPEVFPLKASGRHRDEYPFNKTVEGGPEKWKEGKVSVELVPAGESRRQGTLFSAFVRDSRVGLIPIAAKTQSNLFYVLPIPYQRHNSGYVRRDGSAYFLNSVVSRR